MIKVVRKMTYDNEPTTTTFYVLGPYVFRTVVSSRQYICLGYTDIKSKIEEPYEHKPNYFILGIVTNSSGKNYNTWLETDAGTFTDQYIDKHLDKVNAILTQESNKEILDCLP